jgi:hypothetical protein
VVHQAFLLIDEYQEVIKANGWGPDKSELGHDSNVGYGRAARYPVPKLQIIQDGPAWHFWPTGEMEIILTNTTLNHIGE